jgi:hypothetical protein
MSMTYYILALREIPIKGKRTTKQYEYVTATNRTFHTKRDALFFCNSYHFKYPIVVREDELPKHVKADELIAIYRR